MSLAIRGWSRARQPRSRVAESQRVNPPNGNLPRGASRDSGYSSGNDPRALHHTEPADGKFVRDIRRSARRVEAHLPDANDRQPLGVHFNRRAVDAGGADTAARLELKLFPLVLGVYANRTCRLGRNGHRFNEKPDPSALLCMTIRLDNPALLNHIRRPHHDPRNRKAAHVPRCGSVRTV